MTKAFRATLGSDTNGQPRVLVIADEAVQLRLPASKAKVLAAHTVLIARLIEKPGSITARAAPGTGTKRRPRPKPRPAA